MRYRTKSRRANSSLRRRHALLCQRNCRDTVQARQSRTEILSLPRIIFALKFRFAQPDTKRSTAPRVSPWRPRSLGQASIAPCPARRAEESFPRGGLCRETSRLPALARSPANCADAAGGPESLNATAGATHACRRPHLRIRSSCGSRYGIIPRIAEPLSRSSTTLRKSYPQRRGQSRIAAILPLFS